MDNHEFDQMNRAVISEFRAQAATPAACSQANL
jgi:hypothetical protein